MVFFEKSSHAPKSLSQEKTKANGTYNKEDVLKQLLIDFKNKCYLCEEKDISSVNIEHFVPHNNQNKDLEFDWNNLFFSCSQCNSSKSTFSKPILNCCAVADIDQQIALRYSNSLDHDLKEIVAIDTTNDSKEAKNTAELLDKIYCGKTPNKKITTSNIRNKIRKEIQKFDSDLIEYQEKPNQENLKIIEWHLSNESPFTAFKRWQIRDDENLSEFLKLF